MAASETLPKHDDTWDWALHGDMPASPALGATPGALYVQPTTAPEVLRETPRSGMVMQGLHWAYSYPCHADALNSSRITQQLLYQRHAKQRMAVQRRLEQHSLAIHLVCFLYRWINQMRLCHHIA